ncbi:MAG: heavy-metal-associated domain-containing protein, partial [Actinomycetota bacterium]|nr:heavy-metal-associated domain-containing protein [Actinomycetota bacterium]
MSRPKKMLPILGQTPEPEQAGPDTDVDDCADDCCVDNVAEASASTPATRQENPEVPERGFVGVGFEKTVVRVEGMDCASCATTVERRVVALPGVRRATV